MLKLTFSIFSLLLIAGCSTTSWSNREPPFTILKTTHENQIDSLSLSENIEREIILAGASSGIQLSPKDYLRHHSFYVFNQEAGSQGIKMVHESGSDEWIDPTFYPTDRSESGTRGTCVAIAEDGYLLTANHVIDLPNITIVRLVVDEQLRKDKKMKVIASKAKVIFRDEENDIAILRTDLKLSPFLPMRTTKPQDHETYYSGGRFNKTGLGVLSDWENLDIVSEQGTYRISKFSTNIPMMPGDSGSAVIDQSGNLCGISIAGGAYETEAFVYGESKKSLFKFFYTNHVMIEPDFIMRVIERDRLEQRSSGKNSE